MFRRPVLLVIILFACLTMSACQADFGLEELSLQNQSGTDSNAESLNYDILDKGPVKGGVLKLFSTTPDTLNPILTKNVYVSDFLSLIYESLVKLDKNGHTVPVLADSWTASTDGLVWNFHVRSGVRWHDGELLTAKDIQYTLDFILNSKVDSVYKRQLQNTATYTASDDSNFKMVLRKPNSFTPEMMTFPILPGHSQTNSASIDSTGFKPVGTGPFRLETHEKDKKIVLKADNGWWQLQNQGEKVNEMMYLSQIDINIYDSPDKAITAFQTSNTDVFCINSAEFEKYEGRTDLIMKKYTSRDFEFLAFNLYNTAFADPFTRRAIADSIDIRTIISDAMGGNAIEADLPISPESWLFQDVDKPDSVETVSVGELLKQGGWIEKTKQLKENESKYYKSINGVRKDLNLEILVNSNNSTRVNAANIICRQLASKGISASVVSLPWAEMIARIDSKKYDAALLGCRTTQIPDISFLYSNSYLPTYLNMQGDAGRNISGYNNIDVNSYIERLFYNQTDEGKKQVFSDMKQKIDMEVPYIGLYFTENAVIYRKNVRGVLEPNEWNRYNDITRWYKPEMQ